MTVLCFPVPTLFNISVLFGSITFNDNSNYEIPECNDAKHDDCNYTRHANESKSPSNTPVPCFFS